MKAAAERDYSHYIAVADKTREEEEKTPAVERWEMKPGSGFCESDSVFLPGVKDDVFNESVGHHVRLCEPTLIPTYVT